MVLMLTYGPSEDEKKECWARFAEEDFQFRDTVLTYTLDTSKLTIYFPEKPQYNYWIIESWVNRWDESEGDGEYFGNNTFKIVNGKVVIPIEPGLIKNPKDYRVTVFACPEMGRELVISRPFGNIRAMFREKATDKGTLRPDNYWRGLKFTKFDMKVLDSMDPQMREYCMNKMEAKIH